MRTSRATYLAWVRDEVLLVALLGAALAFFLARPELRDPYDLPSLRLFLDTCVVLVAVIVSVLAYVRFSLERRRFDLFLLGGFFLTAAGTLAFAVAPSLDGGPIGRVELWAGITARLPGVVDGIDPSARVLFGYVVREAVTNVVRHSRARTCTITVGAGSVEIVDDGRGAPAVPGIGLSGLAERVRAAGGTLTAGPRSGGGFAVRATLPVIGPEAAVPILHREAR